MVLRIIVVSRQSIAFAAITRFDMDAEIFYSLDQDKSMVFPNFLNFMQGGSTRAC